MARFRRALFVSVWASIVIEMDGDYLSPVFGERTAEEQVFLREADGRTGFSLFWLDVSRPLLELIGARRLLEVGAAEGQQTRWLLEYCGRNGGELTVIEPAAGAALQNVLEGAGSAQWLRERSHVALPKLTVLPDAVFLEGDLNYAAALHDLREVLSLSKRLHGSWPLIFVSALSWPYARRDMYYDPARLPRQRRHTWARRGLSPWSASQAAGGVNAPFANAVREGGARNGVLTAVEDFIRETPGELRLWRLPMNFGFGILYPAGSPAARFIETMLHISPQAARLLETIEIARLNEILRHIKSPRRWYDTLKRLFYGYLPRLP